MRRSIFLTLAFGLTLTAQAQPIRFSNLRRAQVDQEKGLIILILKDAWALAPSDSITRCNPASACVRYYPAPGIGEFSKDHYFHLSGNDLLFTTPGSGMVYRAGPDSITRIDHSFDHRVQAGAVEFTRRDTIWRHGGYGAFSARTVLTYFDKINGGWEVLRPVRGDEPPPALWNHRHFLDGDSLWLFGGTRFQEKNPGSGLANTAVWLFNFKTRTWKRVGNLTPDGTHLERRDVQFVPWRNGKLFYPTEGSIRIFDFRNNTLELRTEPVVETTIPGTIVMPGDSMLHYLKTASAHSLDFPPDSYDAELANESLGRYLGGEVKARSAIYQTAGSEVRWVMPVALVCLIVLGVAAMLYSRRNHQIDQRLEGILKLTESGITCGDTHHAFEPAQLAVIKLLLESDKEVQTGELISLVGNPQLDHTHNLRLKSQLIDAVNLRLKSILKVKEDPVRVVRSGTDRRIRIYTIEKKYFG